ncbi:MAG: PAS domain S-box protein [Pseudomonadales bacterium]|nr:PAS domain S-box protein [Pseudomonadales bacterium]
MSTQSDLQASFVNFNLRFGLRVLQRGLLLSTPLILVISVGLYFLFQSSQASFYAQRQADHKSVVQEMFQMFQLEIQWVMRDVKYLGQLESLRRFALNRTPADRELAEQKLAEIMQSRYGLYDQLRFIDTEGQELIRIDGTSLGVRIRDPETLQDKSHRYYFQNSINIRLGEYYVSPFDLNIENGAIQKPLNPVIRIARPVRNELGEPLGIVIINYKGGRLLARLREISVVTAGQVWLVNGEGYWLLGPSTEQEWGFMLPAGNNQRLDILYPEIWKKLKGGTDGRFESDLTSEGIVSFSRVRPERVSPNIVSESLGSILYFIVWLSPDLMAVDTEELRMEYLSLFWLLVMVVISFGVAFAFVSQTREETKSQLRSLAEREANEQSFLSAVNSSPTPMLLVDHSHQIRVVNQAAAGLFGYSDYQLVGMQVDELLPHRFRAHHGEYMTNYQNRPVAREMSASTELYCLTSDNREVAVSISLSPTPWKDELMTMASVTDIGKQLQLQNELIDVQSKLAMAVANAGLGIWTLNLSSRHFEFDDQLLSMFGFGKEAVNSADPSNWIARIADEDVSQVKKSFADAVKLRSGFDIEFRIAPQDEPTRWIHCVGHLITDQRATEEYLVGICRDVTSEHSARQSLHEVNAELEKRVRQRTQELENTNRELEAFSYSVSHDLRTPLRSLDGFSQILLKGYTSELDEKGQDYLRRIRAASQRMGNLIDDLLNLSRITRADVEHTRLDLSEMAGEQLAELRELDPDREVQLVAPDMLIVHADRALVRILLQNLLSNAWKFTARAEHARIEIGTTNIDGNQYFFVKDNGVGFDMKYAGKLFGAFQRLHHADDFAGTGIGLATVKRVVSKHGGRIFAEAEPDNGATFYFSLEGEHG